MTLLLAAEGAESVYLVWGVALFGLAILLLLAEIFFPSGGLLGVLTAVCVIASVVAFFMYDTMAGVVSVAAYLVLGPIALMFGLKLWLHSPMSRRLILTDEEIPPDRSEAELAQEVEAARRRRLEELRALVGVEGVAVTSLRPVGMVRIEGERIEALAEGGSIDAGMPVVVTDVYDNQIKVRAR